jgi:membrane-bound lytic murein transglycosylase MltF
MLGCLTWPFSTGWTSELIKGEPFLGDFDQMLERRHVRVLVAYNKMMYFLDGATQRGITYDAFQEFEKYVNEKHDLGARKFHVVFVPVPRDQLLPLLVEGYGDVAAANLTITEERSKLVDFTDPWATDVKEVLVTGPAAPEVANIDDLAGHAVHVRKSSSYFESLTELNRDFADRGLTPVPIVPVDEYLEDGDLIEMVSAGLIPMVVTDNHKAEFWADVFDNVNVRDDIVLREGGSIAQAVRKNSPKLKAVANEFLTTIKKGTMLGNVLFKRYLKENEWAQNARSPDEIAKFDAMVGLFRKYSDQYGFDWLLLIALGFQESGLDNSVRSSAGAVGVMQILPSTAKDPNVDIADIDILENNVHAGAKYLGFLRDQYFSEPGIDEPDRTLLTFAAYNAGPAKIGALREETKEAGLDPDVWFGNVEMVCAKRIGRETTQYVSNIFKYYIAYRLLVDQRDRKAEAKQQVQAN